MRASFHEASPEVGVSTGPEGLPPTREARSAPGSWRCRSRPLPVSGSSHEIFEAVGRRGVPRSRGDGVEFREHLPAHRVAVHRVRGRAVIEVDVVRRAGDRGLRTVSSHSTFRDAERGFLDRLGLAVGARRRRCLAGAMARLGDANVRRARSEGGGRLPAVVHAVRPPVVLPPGPHTAQQRIRVVQVSPCSGIGRRRSCSRCRPPCRSSGSSAARRPRRPRA
jgi:hypothetical protein